MLPSALQAGGDCFLWWDDGQPTYGNFTTGKGLGQDRPTGEVDGHFDKTDWGCSRDPHGAMKLIRSAPFLKSLLMVLQPRAVQWRKRQSDLGMAISGDDLLVP